MKLLPLGLIFALAGSAWGAPQGAALPQQKQIFRAGSADRRLKDLKVDASPLEVYPFEDEACADLRILSPEGKTFGCARIRGEYNRKGWALYLLVQDGRIPLVGAFAANRKFERLGIVQGPSSMIQLLAEGPQGELLYEDVVLSLSPEALQRLRTSGNAKDFAALLPTSGLADRVQVFREGEEESWIKDLRLVDDMPEVVALSETSCVKSKARLWNPKALGCTTLRGEFARPGWELSTPSPQGRIILVAKNAGNREFDLKTVTESTPTRLQLFATGPNREVERETWVLGVSPDAVERLKALASPKARAIVEAAELPVDPLPQSISAGLGYSSITYNQSGMQQVSLGLLTAKVDWRKSLMTERGDPTRWSLGFSGYGTAAQVNTTRTDSVSVRYLGLNGRVSYLLTSREQRWSLEGAMGLYYQTMLVTAQTFGYTNVTGPQLFLRWGAPHFWVLDGGGYFKMAFLSSGFLPSNLKSYEAATGVNVSYAMGSKKAHVLSLGTDISKLNFMIHSAVVGTLSTSVGLSYGYRF